MKQFISKIQNGSLLLLFLSLTFFVFNSCSEDDDQQEVGFLEGTTWRPRDTFVTNDNPSIEQLTFHDGYATYALVNRTTGVIDNYNDLILHGRYIYHKESGQIDIVDYKTGQVAKHFTNFVYKDGHIYNSLDEYFLYK